MSLAHFMCKFFYSNLLIVSICVELLMEIRLLTNIKFANEMNQNPFYILLEIESTFGYN